MANAKLNEHDAWVFLAELWERAKLNPFGVAISDGGHGRKCLCYDLAEMTDEGLVNHDVAVKVKDKIIAATHKNLELSPYLATFDLAGAKIRAKFCRERARVIRKAEKEKVAGRVIRRAGCWLSCPKCVTEDKSCAKRI